MLDLIEKNRKMMRFLKLITFIIPHYHLPLPKEVDDSSSYRAERIFELFPNGEMRYIGFGASRKSSGRDDVSVRLSLKPSELYLKRANDHLMEECRKEADKRAGKSLKNNGGDLLLIFSGLDFVVSKRRIK